MSRLVAMLTRSKPITSVIGKRDTLAQETGLGLGGMTSKIKALDKRDTLAQEGTGGLGSMTSDIVLDKRDTLAQEGTAGLSSMKSTYQSSPGGSSTPPGASSDIKTT